MLMKGESILGKYHCIHLTAHDFIEDTGYIILTNTKIYFKPFNKFAESFEIPVSLIESIERSKLFNFIPAALKIITADGKYYKLKVTRKKEFISCIITLTHYTGGVRLINLSC